MEKFNLLVIDDFYEDPDTIRNWALSLRYERRTNATYPGREALVEFAKCESTVKRIVNLLPEPCTYSNIEGFSYPQGKFHLALEQDRETRKVGVHTDIPRWSAVIYLSKDGNPNGGTQWYQHKPTGELKDSDKFLEYCFTNINTSSQEETRNAIFTNSQDMSQWHEIQSVAMRYNRLIIFRADFFHANNVLFGNDLESARLTQHFVFCANEQLPLQSNSI